MYQDHENQFCTDLDISGAAAVYNTLAEGISAIDLVRTTGRQVGNGEIMRFAAQITSTDLAGGTSVEVSIVSSASADLTTATVHVTSGAVATASLVSGYLFAINAIPRGVAILRYLGVNITTVGTFTGAATISAWLGMDIQTADAGWPAESGFSSP